MAKTDYESIATSFDSRYQGVAYSGASSVLADLLSPFPGAGLLEVGCGTGHWLGHLQESGFEVAGLDASNAMLARAREKLPRVDLVFGRAEKLPWPAGHFDRVLCVNALHHFDDPQAFIREARRVLRPRGMLVTIGLDPHAGLDRWFVYEYFPQTRTMDQARFAPAAKIRQWMLEAGFAKPETSVALRLDEPQSFRGTLEPTITSQLANLTKDEFEAGVDRLRSARDAREGKDLPLVVDLRLFATRAWVAN